MRKHICMIAYTNYTTDARVRRQAETLASQSKFSVRLITPKLGNNPRTYTLNNVKVMEVNCKIYQERFSLRKYLYHYFKFTIFSFIKCTSLLITKKLDVVHIHNMPNFLIFAAIAPRIFGKKLILDMHDTVPETYLVKFNNHSRTIFKILAFEEFICSKIANKIISVNHIQRQALLDRGISSKKIFISMNVPDPKIFSTNHRNTSVLQEQTKFKLVFHGSITKRLGIDLIIQSLFLLVNKIPSLEFHVYGIGDDLDYCIGLARQLKIDNRVYFHGLVPLDSLPNLLRTMNLGVIANRNNIATNLMLPVKLIEYISLGIPVICPRLQTIKHYFSDRMVSYFEPEDVQGLATNIYHLYFNKEERKSLAECARSFLDQYGWEKSSSEFIRFYESL